MTSGRDPLQARDDGTQDLYDVSEWEVRSLLDRLSVVLYAAAVSGTRVLVVLLAGLILLAQVVLGGLGAVANPVVGAFTILSVVPAFLLAAYVWYADVTTSEPLGLLVVTFFLGVLFATFAGILNPVLGGVVSGVGSGFGAFPALGMVFLFFLVVGPVEESVKLLAVRLWAFRDARFDAVIDGAVYGAVAGLGFATIENALYITRSIEAAGDPLNLIGAGAGIATVRALAGPGHVIYSAFAGYYLGLAKFNRENAGPIVVKGIVVAALIHGFYNTSASVLVPGLAELVGLSQIVAFFGFVVVYDGIFGYLLYRKLAAYRGAYNDLHGRPEDETGPVDLTEFEF
ncbi:PrsW family intramembrane metalloprotease [Halobacteriales archaeon QS_1_68_17]|jgi:RsiW-degrading membrane proteinase PrsW (M82 family)|nr:MAG: PrsW family intramembrane metalloprotease [Halobacteriales archaeon QS_1_68_17]